MTLCQRRMVVAHSACFDGQWQGGFCVPFEGFRVEYISYYKNFTIPTFLLRPKKEASCAPEGI